MRAGAPWVAVSVSAAVQTLVRRWLLTLDGAVLVLALALGVTGSRRGFMLAALVPITLLPFTFARTRAHRVLSGVLQPRVLGVVTVAGMACDAAMFAQLLTARSEMLSFLHGPVTSWIGPVWFSTNLLWLLGYLVVALATTALRLAGAWRGPRGGLVGALADAGPRDPSRRAFLQQASVAGAAIPLVAAVSSVPLSYDFRVEERRIVLPGWPRQLDGLRVAHLSDIHVGRGMGRNRLRRVAELTNAARPDVVLHTGDFLTHGRGDFDLPLYEALATVRAPLGQWACLGNHDYDDAERFVRRLADAGVTALRDHLVRLTVDGQPLELAGLEFVFGPLARAAAYGQVFERFGERRAPRLVLNHDPSGFASLPDGAADLVLSGHTHGGHVGLQLGRSQSLTVIGLLGLPDQGLYARDDMRLFVTRCVGFYGYPMRVGIPPEIAVLELYGADAAGDTEPVRA